MNISLSTTLQPSLSPSPSTNLTHEQQNCVNWITSNSGNLIIEAVAGSGKTFTILEQIIAINLNFPEAKIALMTFNSKVAKELQSRVAQKRIKNCTIGTVHKFGFDAFKQKYDSRKPDSYKLSSIIDPLLKSSGLKWTIAQPLSRLVGLMKDSGYGILSSCLEPIDLCEQHEIYPDERDCSLNRFCNLALEVFNRSAKDRSIIDFSDMIYFPLLDNLPFPPYDFVFIDEAQDTNATRREVARRMLKPYATDEVPLGGRLVAVGDRHQSIYGFTGADNDSLDIIKREFHCQELPLSVCFRCSKAVIDHARKLVSHIHPKDGAIAGEVKTIPEYSFENALFLTGQPNEIPGIHTHAILCRKNAPLVSLAFRLLKKKIPCRIEGKDIGQDLIRLCKKFKPVTLNDLTTSLRKHLSEQSTKLPQFKFDILIDKVSCVESVINSLVEGNRNPLGLYKVIESVFSDYDPALPPKLTLSSVHKSKGLEWPTVYLLGRNLFMPSKFATQPWMLEQEKNLIYVAITRAQQTLVEVTINEE